MGDVLQAGHAVCGRQRAAQRPEQGQLRVRPARPGQDAGKSRKDRDRYRPKLVVAFKTATGQ